MFGTFSSTVIPVNLAVLDTHNASGYGFKKHLITPSLGGLSPIKYYVVSWRLGYTFHIIIRSLAHRACWITKLHGTTYTTSR